MCPASGTRYRFRGAGLVAFPLPFLQEREGPGRAFWIPQMESSSFLCASVCRRAATLVERVHILRTVPRSGLQVGPDAERGRRRLEQWRAQEPFSSDGLFGQRLAQAGLTEAELRDLLGQPDDTDSGSSPEPPPWAVEPEQAFAESRRLDLPGDAVRGSPDRAPLPPFPKELRHRTAVGLLEVIRPLLGR